jgi:hypothetical protein
VAGMGSSDVEQGGCGDIKGSGNGFSVGDAMGWYCRHQMLEDPLNAVVHVVKSAVHSQANSCSTTVITTHIVGGSDARALLQQHAHYLQVSIFRCYIDSSVAMLRHQHQPVNAPVRQRECTPVGYAQRFSLSVTRGCG